MNPSRLLATILVGTLYLSSGRAQTTQFDLGAYKDFLSAHSAMQGSQLLALYPAGVFTPSIPPLSIPPAYLDVIKEKYLLTPYECDRLNVNGFVVTSRLARHTFVEAFSDVYQKDLPVFISTDAILQAIHNSYDMILKHVEKTVLNQTLIDLLTAMHGRLASLDQLYGADPSMSPMLRDVDTYLTVPLLLLGKPVSAYYPDNQQWIDSLVGYIRAEKPMQLPLFAETKRLYDFSQFTVRGHYTQDTVLGRYFRAMIWLGRTEVYLTAPKGTIVEWPESDIQRQLVDAILIAETARDAGGLPLIQTIDKTIRFLVGESDNVVVDSLLALNTEAGLQSPVDLLDTLKSRAYQMLLLQKPYSAQRIISQILMTDPCDPVQVEPASAFLLLGQRFVIDSYIAGNVVYDKILYQGSKVCRLLPNTLDILFALGNSAAVQLLQDEIEEYHYAPNLAALRYLIDAYGEDFWTASLFNGWLQMLRTLNPPGTRSTLPPFMQTAAWWQEKMNTQLGSWAQLRHDNLLYAKQSYTPGIICSFPQGYVEPIPEFYHAVKVFAEIGRDRFSDIAMPAVAGYFSQLALAADTLGSIAEKELSATPLTDQERAFLRSVIVRNSGCGEPYTGWYPSLYFGISFTPYDSERNTDFAVADIHTAPTDCEGFPVGWVLHVGTGPVDLCVLTAQLPGGTDCAFVGPVMNYYEHLASNFKRLTDEEWATAYDVAPSLRPTFVNIYLADTNGQSRGSGPSLLTGIQGKDQETLPASPVLYPNYPNPFNSSTLISFTIPGAVQPTHVALEIYDIQGRVVARLYEGALPANNYIVSWDGSTTNGKSVASGVYFCRLTTGGVQLTRKLMLLK